MKKALAILMSVLLAAPLPVFAQTPAPVQTPVPAQVPNPVQGNAPAQAPAPAQAQVPNPVQGPVPVQAPAPAPAQAQSTSNYTQSELDQMLAPVALYPDELLSQMLMASTYPLELVKAARWSRAHPGLKGDDAVRAAASEDWDPSVKSLVAFPDLLARMNEKLDWTQQLGDAFLGQEAQVMQTVQQLRQRAEAAGGLRSDERQRVTDDGGNIEIAPANPQVVYVPYYDPAVVYGGWWWPAYPPVAWAPWPGYAVGYPGFWWGVGIGVTAGFFYGGVSWSTHSVTVVHSNVYYARPPVVAHHWSVAHRPLAVGNWQHDPSHRQGVAYRTPELRQRYAYATRPRASMPTHGIEGPAAHRNQQRDGGHSHAMPPAKRTSGSSVAGGHPARGEPQSHMDSRGGAYSPRPTSAHQMPQPPSGTAPNRGTSRMGYSGGGSQSGGERGYGGGYGNGGYGGHGGGFGGGYGGHGGGFGGGYGGGFGGGHGGHRG